VLRLAAGPPSGAVSGLCLANAESLLAALRFCAGHTIGCFRVKNQILPLKMPPCVVVESWKRPDEEAGSSLRFSPAR